MQLQAWRQRWADIEEESDESSDQEETLRRKSVGSNGDQSTDHVMHEVVPLISENGVENRDYEYWLTWDGPYLWASIKTVFRRPKRSFSGIVASPVIVKGRGRKQSYILQIKTMQITTPEPVTGDAISPALPEETGFGVPSIMPLTCF